MLCKSVKNLKKIFFDFIPYFILFNAWIRFNAINLNNCLENSFPDLERPYLAEFSPALYN